MKYSIIAEEPDGSTETPDILGNIKLDELLPEAFVDVRNELPVPTVNQND